MARITTPPAAKSVSATATGSTSAIVSGAANGHAQTTSFHLEYGPVGAATKTTPEQSLGTTSTNMPVSATLTGLMPSTAYRARVVVTNPTDTTAGGFLPFTTAPPVLSALRVSPRKIAIAGRMVKGKCAKPTKKTKNNKHCRRPIKLKVSYTLNGALTVTFALKRKAPGRKVRGRCVEPTKKNAKKKRCSRLVTVHGKLVKSGKAGNNKFAWNGKLAGHKLKPGSYQLTATPTGGKPNTVTFKIVG